MKAKLAGLALLLLITSSLGAQQNAHSDYPLQLVKHYLTQNETELALRFARMYQTEVSYPDSLAWLTATAYYQLSKVDSAAVMYARVIATSQDSLLIVDSIHRLKRLAPQINPRQAIELYTATLDSLENDSYWQDMVLTLARIYEDTYLLSEANDIYINLLESDLLVNKPELYYNLATNMILLKDYPAAVEAADFAANAPDSTLSARALFIKYIAYSALEDSTNALKPLLKLYQKHPRYFDRWETNISLAQLLLQADMWLPAWYVLEKYYLIAPSYEYEKIIQNQKKILENIPLDDIHQEHFRFFELELDRINGDW